MLAMAYSLQSSIQLLSSYAAYATEGLNHRQEQQLCVAGLKSRSCQQLPGVVLASLCGACSSLVLPRLTRTSA